MTATVNDEDWLLDRATLLRSLLRNFGVPVDECIAVAIVDSRRQQIAEERGMTPARARRSVTDSILLRLAAVIAMQEGAAPEFVHVHSSLDGQLIVDTVMALTDVASAVALDDPCAVLDILSVAREVLATLPNAWSADGLDDSGATFVSASTVLRDFCAVHDNARRPGGRPSAIESADASLHTFVSRVSAELEAALVHPPDHMAVCDRW